MWALSLKETLGANFRRIKFGWKVVRVLIEAEVLFLLRHYFVNVIQSHSIHIVGIKTRIIVIWAFVLFNKLRHLSLSWLQFLGLSLIFILSKLLIDCAFLRHDTCVVHMQQTSLNFLAVGFVLRYFVTGLDKLLFKTFKTMYSFA